MSQQDAGGNEPVTTMNDQYYEFKALTNKERYLVGQIKKTNDDKRLAIFDKRSFFTKNNLQNLAKMDQYEWIRHSTICNNHCVTSKKDIAEFTKRPEKFTNCLSTCQKKLLAVNDLMGSQKYITE